MLAPAACILSAPQRILEITDLPSVVVIEGVASCDKQLLPHGCNVGAGAHELHQGI